MMGLHRARELELEAGGDPQGLGGSRLLGGGVWNDVEKPQMEFKANFWYFNEFLNSN